MANFFEWNDKIEIFWYITYVRGVKKKKKRIKIKN